MRILRRVGVATGKTGYSAGFALAYVASAVTGLRASWDPFYFVTTTTTATSDKSSGSHRVRPRMTVYR